MKHPVSSELENSDIRVAVGDCSVTECRQWRPPHRTGKTVHVHAKHYKWFRTAEPLEECCYENWNTHTLVRCIGVTAIEERGREHFIT